MLHFCSVINVMAAVTGQVSWESDYEMEICVEEVN